MLNVSAFSSNASDLTVSFDKASKILKVTDSGQSITLKRCSGKTPETAPSWSSSVLFVELILLTVWAAPGAVKRHARSHMEIHFVWRFCMGAQGA